MCDRLRGQLSPSLCGRGSRETRTKSSSAAVPPKVAFLGESFIEADMSTRSLEASLLNSASNVDRKGLRDIGLLPELERLAERGRGEGSAGETALLRNGLLDERLRARPGEERRSVDKEKKVISEAPVSSLRNAA